MLDDFTAQYRTARAPLDAVWDKLDYLQHLGVNAIEFMPWTAWPEGRARPFLTVFLPTNAKRKPLRLNKLGSSDVTTLLNQEFTTVLLATSRFSHRKDPTPESTKLPFSSDYEASQQHPIAINQHGNRDA